MRNYILFHENAHTSSNVYYIYIVVAVSLFYCSYSIFLKFLLSFLQKHAIKNAENVYNFFKEVFVFPLIHMLFFHKRTKLLYRTHEYLSFSYTKFKHFNLQFDRKHYFRIQKHD